MNKELERKHREGQWTSVTWMRANRADSQTESSTTASVSRIWRALDPMRAEHWRVSAQGEDWGSQSWVNLGYSSFLADCLPSQLDGSSIPKGITLLFLCSKCDRKRKSEVCLTWVWKYFERKDLVFFLCVCVSIFCFASSSASSLLVSPSVRYHFFFYHIGSSAFSLHTDRPNFVTWTIGLWNPNLFFFFFIQSVFQTS